MSGMMLPMTQQTPTLIGTAEAARLLGKSHRTVHRLVAHGDLTPVTTAPGGQHGSFLFNRADVERIAKQKSAAA